MHPRPFYGAHRMKKEISKLPENNSPLPDLHRILNPIPAGGSHPLAKEVIRLEAPWQVFLGQRPNWLTVLPFGMPKHSYTAKPRKPNLNPPHREAGSFIWQRTG